MNVVGDSNVGVIEGIVNDRLAGDRRCRFFVYRRSNFRNVVGVARRRVRNHRPKSGDLRIILYAGLDDILSEGCNFDIETLWRRIDSDLSGLAADCQRKKVSLVVCSIPRVDAPTRIQQACHYINRAMAKKFSGTQVIFHDLYRREMNQREINLKVPECGQNEVFLAAELIAFEVAAYLGLRVGRSTSCPGSSEAAPQSPSFNPAFLMELPYNHSSSFFQQVPPPPVPPQLRLPIFPEQSHPIPIQGGGNQNRVTSWGLAERLSVRGHELGNSSGFRLLTEY